MQSDESGRVAEPKAFLSFKHNRPIVWVAGALTAGLEQRFIEVIRLIDNPRTGEKFTESIREGITRSDALIALWTTQGSSSHYVKLEYRTARELRKPVALIRGHGNPPLPPDWDPDERYETMHMIAFRGGIFANAVWAHPTIVNRKEWDALLDRLASYARDARDGKIKTPEPTKLF